ncbi:MAG: hypothetical protein JWN27_4174, partial [Candidatus Eremiobacteraeota bacterium]|nr:hypothetical protein [Candidatus Eremiobacteraeota bacterium]
GTISVRETWEQPCARVANAWPGGMTVNNSDIDPLTIAPNGVF